MMPNPKISKIGQARLAKYNPVIEGAAKATGVDPQLLRAVALQETLNSDQVPDPSIAVSSAGAIGPMQLMQSTADSLGVDPTKPEENIQGGAQYLAQMMKKYGGDQERALAAYNAGPKTVDSLIENHGTDWKQFLPEQTKNYLPSINGYLSELNTPIPPTASAQQIDGSTAVNYFMPMPDTKYRAYREQFPQYNDISDIELVPALWESKYKDIPFPEFFQAFNQQYQDKVTPPSGFFGDVWANLSRGILDTAKNVASAYDYITGQPTGGAPRVLEAMEKSRYPMNPSITPITDLSSFTDQITNWHWWTQNLIGSVPFMATTIGLGVVTGGAADAVLSPALGRIFGVMAGDAALSLTQAGEAYKQALDGGQTEESASQAANTVLGGSLIINSVAQAAEIGTAFKALRIPIVPEVVSRSTAAIAGRIAKQTATFGVQMTLDHMVSNVALGRPISEGVTDVAVSSAVTGLGFGAGSEIIGSTRSGFKTLPLDEKQGPPKLDEKPEVPVSKEPVVGNTPVPVDKVDTHIPDKLTYTGKYVEETKGMSDGFVEDWNRMYYDHLTDKGQDKEAVSKLLQMAQMSQIDISDPRQSFPFLREIVEESQKYVQDQYDRKQTAVKSAPKSIDDAITKVAEKSPVPSVSNLKSVNGLVKVGLVTFPDNEEPVKSEKGGTLSGTAAKDVPVNELLHPIDYTLTSGTEIRAGESDKFNTAIANVLDVERSIVDNITSGKVKIPFWDINESFPVNAAGEPEEWEHPRDMSAPHALATLSNTWDIVRLKAAEPSSLDRVLMGSGTLGKMIKESVDKIVQHFRDAGLDEKAIAEIADARKYEYGINAMMESFPSKEHQRLGMQILKILAGSKRMTVDDFLRHTVTNFQIDERYTSRNNDSISISERNSGKKFNELIKAGYTGHLYEKNPTYIGFFTDYFARFLDKENYRKGGNQYVARMNLSSFIHEFFHIYTPWLDEKQMAIIADHFGVKSMKDLSSAHMEELAYDFEKYVTRNEYTGKSTGVRRIFGEIKRFLMGIGEMFVNKHDIPAPLKALFEQIVDAGQRFNEGDTQPQLDETLARYNEKPLGGDKILGHITNVTPDQLNDLADKLLPYHTTVYMHDIKTPDGETKNVADVFYTKGSDAKAEERAISYAMQTIDGSAGKRAYQGYLRAIGRDEPTIQILTKQYEKEMQDAKVQQTQEEKVAEKKAPRGDTTPEKTKERLQAREVTPVPLKTETLEQKFGQPVTGEGKIEGVQVRDFAGGNLKENPDIQSELEKSNKAAMKEVAKNPTIEGIRAIHTTMGEEGIKGLKALVVPLGDEAKKNRKLDVLLQQFAVEKEKSAEFADESKDSDIGKFIENNRDIVTAMKARSALSQIIQTTRDPEVREKALNAAEKLRAKIEKDPSLKGRIELLEEGVANDPDRSRNDLIESAYLTKDQRTNLYEELGISPEVGDTLNEDDIETMQRNKMGTDADLYSVYPANENREGQIERDSREQMGRLRLSPSVIGEHLKNWNLDKEGRQIAYDKVKRMIFTPQVLGRLSKSFEKVFRMVTDGTRIRNKFITDVVESKEWTGFLRSSDDVQRHVFEDLRDGTTYGGKQTGGPTIVPEPPWSQRNIDKGNWIETKTLAEQLDKGEITVEQFNRTMEAQRNSRSDWQRQYRDWAKSRNKIGKVFSEDELKARGRTPEEIQHYFNLRQLSDQVVDRWKRAAIASGMSPDKAEETFSLTGYWNMDRGQGNWAMMVEDPTSSTGYTYNRYENYTDAMNDYRHLVSEGAIDPKNERNLPHRFKESIGRYAPYMSTNQLIDLLEESGYSLDDITRKVESPEIPDFEKDGLKAEKQLLEDVMRELKKRTYIGQRQIHRNNANMLINPKQMTKTFENFVWKTGNRFANAITSKELDGMVRDMSDGEWKQYAYKYVRQSFEAKDFASSKMWDNFRNIGYLYGVASNVSNGLLNATQPYFTTIPYLVEWKIGKVATLMGKGTAVASNWVFRNGKVSDAIARDYPGLEQCLNDLKTRAVISPSLNEEIVGSTGRRKFMDYATLPQSASEKHNRVLTAFTGYAGAIDQLIPRAKGNYELSRKLAEITGLTERQLEMVASTTDQAKIYSMYEDGVEGLAKRLHNGTASEEEIQRVATQFAKEATDTTQFVFGRHNYPQYVRSMGVMSGAAKAGYLFKGFQNNFLGFVYSSIKNDNAGKTLPYALIPTATKVAALAPLLLLSGMTGLPFADDIKQGLRQFGIMDADAKLRELINDPKWSDFILKGAPSILPSQIAFDMSRRAGLGMAAPAGTTTLEYGKFLTDIFGGAPFQAMSNIPGGIKDLQEGNYTTGFRKMLPVVAQNLIKATLEMPDRGAMTGGGKVIESPDQISAIQRVIQGIGFKPLSVAVAEDESSYMKFIQKKYSDKSQYFSEKFANAIANGNASDMQDILESVMEWNSKQTDPALIYNYSREMSNIKKKAVEKITGETQVPKRFMTTDSRAKALYGIS